jgi:hypothetical protein
MRTHVLSRPRRAALVAIALCALAGARGAIAAPAPTVYSVVAGPKWSTSGTLSLKHVLDCTTDNPYFDNHACTLNVDTDLAGCRWEKQSTDGIADVPSPSSCRVTMNGPVPFMAVGAYCHLGTTDDSIKVTYTVGKEPGHSLSPIEFYASPVVKPLKFNGASTATTQYGLTVTAKNAVATAGGGPGIAVASVYETFLVDFGYPVKDVCPNRDNDALSKGNVRDSRPDTIQQENAPTGYISATLITN